MHQDFKNLHHGILTVFPVFQVFHAYPINQVHIPLVQGPQNFQIRLFTEPVHQFTSESCSIFMYDAGFELLGIMKIKLLKVLWNRNGQRHLIHKKCFI